VERRGELFVGTLSERLRTPAWAIATLVAACLPLAGSPASALNLNEWIPGLTLSPFFSERVEYETNVFQVPTGAKSDVISRSIPGIVGDYTVGPLSLGAGYRAEILRYLDLTSQDTVHHIAVGQVRLDLPRLQLSLRDDFAITSDPPGTELTGRIKSTTNTLAPTAEYRLTERFSTGLNATWTHQSFEGGSSSGQTGSDTAVAAEQQAVKQLDRDEYLFGATVFWKFRPKADLRLDYGYGIKTFSNDSVRDVTRQVLTVGLRGDVTSKLQSTFRIGIEDRQPDSDKVKGYTGFVTGGGWLYQPTERTKISLETERSVQESVFANAVYYIANSGSLSVEQVLFTPKLLGTVALGLGENVYPTKATINNQTKYRQDLLTGARTGLVYTIQPWLRASIEYGYQKRRSNFKDFDFEDQKVSGRITAQF
jgi:hypothetical protein